SKRRLKSLTRLRQIPGSWWMSARTGSMIHGLSLIWTALTLRTPARMDLSIGLRAITTAHADFHSPMVIPKSNAGLIGGRNLLWANYSCRAEGMRRRTMWTSPGCRKGLLRKNRSGAVRQYADGLNCVSARDLPEVISGN